MIRRALMMAGLLLALSTIADPASIAAQRPEITVGQLRIATSQDPAEGFTAHRMTTHGVGENLYTVGKNGLPMPMLAESLVQQDDGSWLVTLKPGAIFSDGVPLTAAHVAAALNHINEKVQASRATAGRLTLTAEDARTVRITSEEPAPAMDTILAEWAHVVYRQEGDRFLYTGPYAITELTPDDEVRLTPNPYYAGADERPDIVVKEIREPLSLALALEAGEVDLAFNIPVETAARLGGRDGIHIKSYLTPYMHMMWMNMARPPLGDVRVRRAIDLAIDRDLLVQAIQSGEPATGLYATTFPFALETPRPFDRDRANRALDEAGWLMGADGRRTKDGVPLELTLWSYPRRPDLMTMQPVLKALLEEVGIGIDMRVAEDPLELSRTGEFDLLLWAQHTAPAGDPAYILNFFFTDRGRGNPADYRSPEIDAILDRMDQARDPVTRAKLAGEVQSILFRDVPVSFLATPDWFIGLSDRLRDYDPWGAEYYTIRADLRVSD